MISSTLPLWRTTLGVIGGLFLLTNCSRQDTATDPGTAGTVQASSLAPTGPPPETGATAGTASTLVAPVVQANSRSTTVERLSLRFENGGHVNLSGKDRWGGDYNITYENPKFLLEALPVLERTFSPKQVEALRKQLEQPPAETAK